MIIVTGAAGFIGSCLVGKLNEEGYNDIVIVDDFSHTDKNKNLEGKIFSQKVERNLFQQWLKENHRFVQFIFHIGARTDTTEFNREIFDELNLNYTKDIWNTCVEFGLPLVYASSAATYGGSDTFIETPAYEHPLNVYGYSKLLFDQRLRHLLGTKFEKAKSQAEKLPFLREKAIEQLHDAIENGTIKVLRTAFTNGKRAKLCGIDDETGGVWSVDVMRDAALELENAKQNKRLQDAQKDLVAKLKKCFIRTDPIGRDRFGNRFVS